MSLRPVPDPHEFGTTDGYSPRDIHTRATDGKGNSSEIRVRVPPTVAGELAAIVESRQVPGYRTSADIVRDAIYHRLKYVTEEMVNDPSIEKEVQAELASSRLHRLKDRIEWMDQAVADAGAALRKAKESGNTRTLHEALSEAEDLADGLSDPWKGQVEELMREYRGG